MGISTLVVSDLDRFVEMKDFWDRELRDHVDDPFLFSSMIIEHWKFGQRVGEHPFLIIFLLDKTIAGFAPLRMRSRFGFRQIFSLDQYTPPVFFSNSHREIFVDILFDFLFKQLNCESADITFEDDYSIQRILETACRKKDLKYAKLPQEGRAIIPVETNLDSYRGSLDRKTLKEFGRFGRKLDRLGSWKIYCSNLDRSSIGKIWTVERYSWKVSLKGKENAIKDMGLDFCLKGVQRNDEDEHFFDSEVWFLELNNLPIAYVLVFKRNKTVFFAKTSFDTRFSSASPGKFLINDLIERTFRDNNAEKIDFISNLPFVRIWNPLVKQRTNFRISKANLLSKTYLLVFENPISQKAFQILEQLKWAKRTTLN